MWLLKLLATSKILPHIWCWRNIIYLNDKEDEALLDRISENVVKARKEKGYSQLKLATEMGYSSASYLGRMEIRKDGQHFHIVQLGKIAKILDIDICKLFKE